jgi:hypothetical protein
MYLDTDNGDLAELLGMDDREEFIDDVETAEDSGVFLN